MPRTIVDELESRRRHADQVRENSARIAQQFATFDTTGQGSVAFEDKVDFQVTFIEKPMVAYAGELDIDDLADVQNVEAGEMPMLPISCGFVTDWDIDTRGYYVGAWCAVRVYFPPEDLVDVTLDVEMTHNFTFAAIALKDVDTTLDA